VLREELLIFAVKLILEHLCVRGQLTSRANESRDGIILDFEPRAGLLGLSAALRDLAPDEKCSETVDRETENSIALKGYPVF
jgi:hypothetical protein